MTGGVVSGGGRRRGGGTTSAFLHPDASARPDPRTNLPSTCAIIEGGITHLPPSSRIANLCVFEDWKNTRETYRFLSTLIGLSSFVYPYISLSLSLSPRPIYLHPFLGIFFISSVALFPIPIFPISISPFQSLSLSLSLAYIYTSRAIHPSIHPSSPLLSPRFAHCCSAFRSYVE